MVKSRMRCGGGQGGGDVFSGIAHNYATWLEDEDFVLCSQLRIGCLLIPSATYCRNANKDGKVCMHLLTQSNVERHIHACTKGPWHVRNHHGYASRLSLYTKESKQFVDQEAECKEFKVDLTIKAPETVDHENRKDRDGKAIMDIVISDNLNGSRRFIDVTVRGGLCDKYREGVARQGNYYMHHVAKQDKLRRYKSSTSAVVECFSVDGLGRPCDAIPVF